MVQGCCRNRVGLFRVAVAEPSYCSAGRRSGFFVYRDPQSLQKPLILSGKPDAPAGRNLLWLGKIHIFGRFFAFLSLVKSDRGFENEENVVTGTLDLANRFRDAL